MVERKVQGENTFEVHLQELLSRVCCARTPRQSGGIGTMPINADAALFTISPCPKASICSDVQGQGTQTVTVFWELVGRPAGPTRSVCVCAGSTNEPVPSWLRGAVTVLVRGCRWRRALRARVRRK